MAYKPGTNTGHGHVWERPDGMRVRCGGPRMCKECGADLAGMWRAPDGPRDDAEYEALQFLCDEWDHDFHPL